MVINVSVQYNNSGFLPEIILLTIIYDYVGNPFNTVNVELLSSQPMFPRKPFDCSGGLAAFRFFLNYKK